MISGDNSSSSYPSIRRVIEGEETEAIIEYLRKNPNSTIDKVAKHLQQEGICSRLTTLSIIEQLLVLGMLRDDRRGRYFHSLRYDENFDFRGLAASILKRDIKQTLNIFDRFVFDDTGPTEDELKQLHNYLDEAINEYYNKGVSELRKRQRSRKKP